MGRYVPGHLGWDSNEISQHGSKKLRKFWLLWCNCYVCALGSSRKSIWGRRQQLGFLPRLQCDLEESKSLLYESRWCQRVPASSMHRLSFDAARGWSGKRKSGQASLMFFWSNLVTKRCKMHSLCWISKFGCFHWVYVAGHGKLSQHHWRYGRSCCWCCWHHRQMLPKILLACTSLPTSSILLFPVVYRGEWMGNVWNAGQSVHLQHASGHSSCVEACQLCQVALRLWHDAVLVGPRSNFFEAVVVQNRSK